MLLITYTQVYNHERNSNIFAYIYVHVCDISEVHTCLQAEMQFIEH